MDFSTFFIVFLLTLSFSDCAPNRWFERKKDVSILEDSPLKFKPYMRDRQKKEHSSFQLKAPKPPEWPKKYFINGELDLPYAEIREPFSAWYDSSVNSSRIDYYGGLFQTYQIAQKNKTYPSGYGFKVTYMTNYTKNGTAGPIQTCFQVNKTSIQLVFPNTTGYTFEGFTNDQGTNVSIWQKVETFGQKVNKYKIWINTATSIPTKFLMMGYDNLFGSHYDKYLITYTNYSSDLGKDPFKLPKSIKSCRAFVPESGFDSKEERILSNPMAEFIHGDDRHVDEMFGKFKQKHRKSYQTDKEETKRKHIFRHNIRFVHSTNRKSNLTFKVALNHLADLDDAELKAMRGRLHSAKGPNGGLPFRKEDYDLKRVPDHVNWRLYGAVTQVKDQAICGSCWSFGTTGTIEGSLFLRTGRLVRLSQQALMDCSWGQGNSGCDGGEEVRSYEWIMLNGGLPTEEAYGPYLAANGKCHAMNMSVGVRIQSYVNVTTWNKDQQALKIAVAYRGPISVAIDAAVKSFSFYSHGIYSDPACKSSESDLDHAVLLVGYGVLNGEPYWLIKNSWSTYWGNNGYVLISRRDNVCGVGTSPTFVNVIA